MGWCSWQHDKGAEEKGGAVQFEGLLVTHQNIYMDKNFFKGGWEKATYQKMPMNP